MATTPSPHKNSPHRNVHYISLSFFLVFSGVNSALVFGTSDYGDYAATSLSILYISFGLSALFIVPFILNNKILSAKYCTFFGSLVEIVFISEYIVFINKYYLYSISIIQGIGISMYWIGSQRYIIKCANYYEERNNFPKNTQISNFEGIYFSFYESSTFVSNLLSAILFTLKLSNSTVYTLFTIICCFGCGITLFADNIKDENKGNDKDKNIKYKYDTFERVSTSSIYDSLLSTIKLWKNPKLQCLMLMSIYFGLYQEFEYGIFPTLIKNKSIKFFIMACYGVSGAIFCKLFGKISQRINRYYIIICGIFINILIYIFILNIIASKIEINIIYLFIIAILNGIVESSFFIILFTLYPIINGNTPEILANQQFFQQFGLALGYFLYSILDFNGKIIFNFISLFLAGFVFFKSDIVGKYINYKKQNEDDIYNEISKIDENHTIPIMIIPINTNKLKDDYMLSHDIESDGYESTYSEI